MKLALVVIFTIIGLLFLVIAAAIAGGLATAAHAGWLLPGGLAAWCLAWLVSVLPIP